MQIYIQNKKQPAATGDQSLTYLFLPCVLAEACNLCRASKATYYRNVDITSSVNHLFHHQQQHWSNLSLACRRL